jgi:hypothetical protein
VNRELGGELCDGGHDGDHIIALARPGGTAAGGSDPLTYTDTPTVSIGR